MNMKPGSIIRLIAGGYVFYLGVQLIRQLQEERPSNMALLMVFAVLFIIVGGGIVIFAVKGVLRSMKDEKLEQAGESIDDIVDEHPESSFVDLEEPDVKVESLEDANKPEVDIVNLDKAKGK